VEIPRGEKSAMSETSNFWITFYTFFWKPLQKKRKKSRFFKFKKNVKNVYSNDLIWFDLKIWKRVMSVWPKSMQFIVASIAKNIGRRTAEIK